LIVALLICTGVALSVGSTREPAFWVPLACLFLGLSLTVLAGSVAAVNWSRDGDDQAFLLPSRAGTIETRSRMLATIYPMFFGALGLFIAGVSLFILLPS
jgi:hypothetical protein